VTALDADLQAAGTHCTHCLRHIQPDMSLSLTEESNRLACTFCSKACLVSNRAQSHSLLFTDDPPLPPELVSGIVPPEVLEERKRAQENFATYVKKEGRATPLLVARFIARQVVLETNKIVDNVKKTIPEKSDFMDTENSGYQLADHIERLRFLDVVPPKEEYLLLVDVLKNALPGLDHFVLDERHAILHGKMAYNAYGVTFGGGRDDKVSALFSCCLQSTMFTRITSRTA
jgi:import receptor subunit TOM20